MNLTFWLLKLYKIEKHRIVYGHFMAHFSNKPNCKTHLESLMYQTQRASLYKGYTALR